MTRFRIHFSESDKQITNDGQSIKKRKEEIQLKEMIKNLTTSKIAYYNISIILMPVK